MVICRQPWLALLLVGALSCGRSEPAPPASDDPPPAASEPAPETVTPIEKNLTATVQVELLGTGLCARTQRGTGRTTVAFRGTAISFPAIPPIERQVEVLGQRIDLTLQGRVGPGTVDGSSVTLPFAASVRGNALPELVDSDLSATLKGTIGGNEAALSGSGMVVGGACNGTIAKVQATAIIH
jgi:hypothetical protein